MNRSIKVLIVDDSALVRQTLSDIINSDPQLEVLDVAADPFFAAQKIRKAVPDVITLDIEMPRMDGLTFLKTLMSQHPIPVVMISSLTPKGSKLALEALELGAVEIISKSDIRYTKEGLEESRIRITDAIKATYMAPLKRHTPAIQKPVPAPSAKPRVTAGSPGLEISDKIIAVGASTGGTEAIRYLLTNVPSSFPGIVIVQHMPSGFTRSFAESLNSVCKLAVKEASDGERVMRGHAYICPGGYHMTLERSGSVFYIKIKDGELVNRHRPSVDVLFRSVAQNAGHKAAGVLMTGMGRDGAEGLLQMKNAGALTIAQDEQSCIVYGMPKEAVKINAARYVLPLHNIPQKLFSLY